MFLLLILKKKCDILKKIAFKTTIKGVNMKKIAFIGAGNMASAICGGIISSKVSSAENIILFDKNKEQYKRFDNVCTIASSIKEAVELSDCIFLSVKPQTIKDVLNEIKNVCIDGKLFVSICAGITIESIQQSLKNAKIIRTMPNTPLLIGKGVTALCKNSFVSDEEFAFAKSIFSSSGIVTELNEEEINKITAITSSSPAYVYLFAKAMMAGAESMGFNHQNTLEMICRTIIGAAEMVLSDSRSVDELIQMVKSPNGTTEKALNVFEERDFIGIMCDAMKACEKRANELAQMN